MEFVCDACGVGFEDRDACPRCGVAASTLRCDRHPERRAPARCVFCQRAVCRECGEAKYGVWRCSNHTEIPMVSGWAEAFRAPDEIRAGLIRSALAAEGIPARTFGQQEMMYVVRHEGLGAVRVLVPPMHFFRALEAISGEGTADLTEGGEMRCPLCGGLFESGSRECTRCGEIR